MSSPLYVSVFGEVSPDSYRDRDIHPLTYRFAPSNPSIVGASSCIRAVQFFSRFDTFCVFLNS
ncbi:hypothetical protein, partial [Flavobacterium sp.]|uniref:hypothetical protein n=1 Tax=Flavobacterium sp. TaxID=239 RepID=UPI003B9A7EB4